MESFFKRGLLACVFLTVGFWFMHFAMIENGADHPRNPAWQLIGWLKSRFAWVGVISVGGVILFYGVFFFMSWIADIQAKKRRVEKEQVIIFDKIEYTGAITQKLKEEFMDMEVLKKKISTFRGEGGRVRITEQD